MNIERAKQFTSQWIEAWNKHDLTEILSHYTDQLTFHSPLITALKFNETGVITTKSALREYFEIGLKTYPDLRFELRDYLVGVNTLVIYYTSVNGRIAAEFFELNEDGKAVSVCCHYAEPK